MYTQSEFYAKYKKYSAAQLQLLLPKVEGEKLKVITGILKGRGKLPAESGITTKVEPKKPEAKKSPKNTSKKEPFVYIADEVSGDDEEDDKLAGFELPEDLEEITSDSEPSEVEKTALPEKKEPKPKKEVVPPTTPESAKVTSEDPEIQKMIDELHTMEGDEMYDHILELKNLGIDVEYIRFLKKGDKVKFKSAQNSKYRGEEFDGIVINITDTDKNGKAYCKVKTTKYGTFQKQQSSVVVIERA